MTTTTNMSLALRALGAIDPSLEAIGCDRHPGTSEEGADLGRLTDEYAQDSYARFDPQAHLPRPVAGLAAAVRRFAKAAMRWKPESDGACRCHEPTANFIYKAARLVLAAEQMARRERWASAAGLYRSAALETIAVRSFGDRSQAFRERTAFSAGVLFENAGEMYLRADDSDSAMSAYKSATDYFYEIQGSSDSRDRLVGRALKKFVDIHLSKGNFAFVAALCDRRGLAAPFVGEYVIDEVYPLWFAQLAKGDADLMKDIIPVLKRYVDLCLRMGRLDDAERKLTEFDGHPDRLQGKDEKRQLVSQLASLWRGIAERLFELARHETHYGNDAKAGITHLRGARASLHAREIILYRRFPSEFEPSFSLQDGPLTIALAKWALRRALVRVPAEVYELSARVLEIEGFLGAAFGEAQIALGHYYYDSSIGPGNADTERRLLQMCERLEGKKQEASNDVVLHKVRAAAFGKEDPPRYSRVLEERLLELKAMKAAGGHSEDEMTDVVNEIVRLTKMIGTETESALESLRDSYMSYVKTTAWLAREDEIDELVGYVENQIARGDFEDALDVLKSAEPTASVHNRAADICEMKAWIMGQMARRMPTPANLRSAAQAFCEAAMLWAKNQYWHRRAAMLYETGAANCMAGGDVLGAAMALGHARDIYEVDGMQGDADRTAATISNFVSGAGGSAAPAGVIPGSATPHSFLPQTAFEISCFSICLLPGARPL